MNVDNQSKAHIKSVQFSCMIHIEIIIKIIIVIIQIDDKNELMKTDEVSFTVHVSTNCSLPITMLSKQQLIIAQAINRRIIVL